VERKPCSPASGATLGGQGVIAVVGTLELQGRPALIGTIYRAGGAMFRSAVTTLDGDRVTNIRSLAKYLADGTVSPELNVIPNGGKEPVGVLAAMASLGPFTTTGPAKALDAAGLIAITTGCLLYMTGHADGTVREDRRTAAVQVVVGGAVVLGAGTYLWLREARSTNRLTAAALGAGASAIIAGGTLFFTDEDALDDSRYYRETERIGLIVGTAGLAITGIGPWLLHREGDAPGTSGASEAARRHHASIPIIAAGPRHALLGWAGASDEKAVRSHKPEIDLDARIRTELVPRSDDPVRGQQRHRPRRAHTARAVRLPLSSSTSSRVVPRRNAAPARGRSGRSQRSGQTPQRSRFNLHHCAAVVGLRRPSPRAPWSGYAAVLSVESTA
jgi:hypothetical protein